MSATNQTALTDSLEALLQSIWNDETYRPFYDEAYCLNQNVTYGNRVDAENNFNFCSVPLSGADAFLFAALALLAASVCMGKLQSVWVLVIGGCLGILNYEVNLQRLGNAISLWLGIQPPDLFFYAFLPPLLVDAALRLDWFTFSKLWPHIVLMAYGMVIINAAVLAPFILFVLGFSSRGWNWIQGAVLAAMLAPTDAVAVTAILKAGGGPENMVTIMEGEALLNDASAVTLYTVFLEILMHSSTYGIPSVPSQIWPIIRDILKLTGIGVGIGLAFAWALGYVLKLLRWRGAKPYIESLVVLAAAYLAFYGPAKGSGVIAVCLFGLYGSASGHWGMLATDAESGIHEAVWDTVAFAANALVFFWSGISSVNFVARSASHLNKSAWNYCAIPIIFLFMYGFRGVCLMAFNPIFKLMGARLSLPETAFATVAGLRGSLTLIMAADFIIHSDFYTGGPVDEANFDVVLWASAFVLLSLLINAPSIGPVMRWTGLSRISPERIRGRKRALEELQGFTDECIAELKHQQDGEFLQGANWSLVATFVEQTPRLKGFVPQPRGRRGAKAAPSPAPAAAADKAAAAAGNGSTGAAAETAAGPSKGRHSSWSSGRRTADGEDADEYEVPFGPPTSGLAAARASETSPPSHGLEVSLLRIAARGSSLPGSFYEGGGTAADVAAAAAASAAAAAVSSALAGAGVQRPGSLHSGSFAAGDGEEEAAARMVMQRIGAVAQHHQATASRGSTRDLLGRLQRKSAGAQPSAGPAQASQQGVSAALLTRAPSKVISQALIRGRSAGVLSAAEAGAAGGAADLESGLGSSPSGGSPKHASGSERGSEEGSEEGLSSLQDQRLRVLNGLKRHFRAKRLGGLLSPEGLRIAIYACDVAIEHAEEHPDAPLRLWDVLHKEISGSRATRAVAGLLGGTLRLHRRAPAWWRKVSTLPFRLFTGLLRRHLGSKMLIACEVTVELYMGLAASPQMQWVYFGQDGAGPAEVLGEVQAQLLGAYAFIQDREAEAPAQYRAVQSYRAAMAVLRQQRAFIASLYERGQVDEEEREQLHGAVDAAMRHLDMTGEGFCASLISVCPIWRPPAPNQVVRSLDVFSGAPADLTDMLLVHARLTEYRPDHLIWSSDDAHQGGFFLVVSGVVRQSYEGADGKASEKLQGVGTIFGELAGLCGTRLPGSERVVACGNSFGRGPLVYHFPEAAVAALRKRAASGDAEAQALELELLRVAALHAVQHVQGALQAAVKTYLQRHRPLTKYTASASVQQQLLDRAGRYAAQVLLDVLQGIPAAALVRLGPGEHFSQHAHVLLLQAVRIQAGPDGALMLVCAGPLGTAGVAAS
ncbi:hypothetical protein COHA_004736 [Chlorella ohadii]|uniref:Cyclic nucleotide-binding domain-containing protein n=1 Tax=Chlorella ohadii TaxID=2649997 RepID=A0AAD5H2L3_9CHLO|nr:hypothetical protein COHA_004736 [Chlorella ohadii]